MATIGIDVTALSTPASGGIGTSQYQTMRALAALDTSHRFIMYAATPPVVPFSNRELDVDFPLRIGSGITAGSNILWMQTGVNRMLAEDGVDVFWSPRHLLPFRARGVLRVATVQDFWHLHHPGQQPLLNRTVNTLLIGRILKVADSIVTTSQATADDAIAHYGVPAERITVVPLGVDSTLFRPASEQRLKKVRERFGLTRPYLVSLDVFNPRKNFSSVLAAFAGLPASLRDTLEVVGVGRRRATAASTDPMAVARTLGIAGQVHVLDDVGFDDLVALYSGALAFVYPSVYEGFGMPVLEAMACGTPVITSNRSSLPEVAGDAAILVDPDDATAIANAIASVVTDVNHATALAKSGLRRAALFPWRRTAEGMLDVFDATLGGR